MLTSRNQAILYPLFLLGVALIIFTHEIRLGELFFNNDETRHAMTGVYFYDLLRDLPGPARLYDYTWEYYGRYPALGLLVWPPFFYLVEGGFYALFGVSAVSARGAVVFFALIAVFYGYRLVRAMYGERLALIAGLFLVANPFMVLYARQVMLEVPSLALCLVTIYYFYRYTENQRRADLAGFAIGFSLALLTKIHTVFMAPMFFLYLWRAGKIRWLWRREVLLALGFIAVAAGPYTLFSLKVQSGRFMQEATQGTSIRGSAVALRALLYYPSLLPEQLGWVVLIAGLGYIGYMIRRRALGQEALFVFWIVAVFAVFVAIAQKAPRFTMYWIPPFVILGVLALDRLSQRVRNARVAYSLMALLAGGLLIQAYLTKKEFIEGYAAAARYIVENYKPKTTVFFHGYYDGNLIFHVRQFDPLRRIPVLVGIKMLVATNIFPEYGMDIRVHNAQQIEQLFADYGTKHVILEDLDKVELGEKLPPIFDTLRQIVQSAEFRLVKQIPIETNIPAYRGHTITIYENRRDVELKTDFIQFKMLTLGGREVRIRLK